jgi:hypothetical protein
MADIRGLQLPADPSTRPDLPRPRALPIARQSGAEKQVVVLRLEGIGLDPLVRDLEAAGHTVLSATG